MQATKKIVIPDEDGGFLGDISLSNFSFNFLSDIEKDGSTDSDVEKLIKSFGRTDQVRKRIGTADFVEC